METKFEAGNVVTVANIRSPRMVIMHETRIDEEAAYRCMWFDRNQVLQERDFPEYSLAAAQVRPPMAGPGKGHLRLIEGDLESGVIVFENGDFPF